MSAAEATKLKDYLKSLADDTFLAVVTCDEPSKNLYPVVPTLRRLGANVSDVRHRGGFTFVAKIGAPSMTKLDKVLNELESKTRQPKVDVLVQGRTLLSYRITNFFTVFRCRKATVCFLKNVPLCSFAYFRQILTDI